MYGAHNGYSGKTVNKMNNDPNEASCWKGRILVEYFTEDCKYPAYKIRDLPQESVQRMEQVLSPRQYHMYCEIGSGVALPTTEKYQIKVVLGKEEFKTGEAIKSGDSFCRWDKRFDKALDDTYQSLKRFPYLFVYLVNEDDKPVCFWKESVLNLQDERMPMNWN